MGVQAGKLSADIFFSQVKRDKIKGERETFQYLVKGRFLNVSFRDICRKELFLCGDSAS